MHIVYEVCSNMLTEKENMKFTGHLLVILYFIKITWLVT